MATTIADFPFAPVQFKRDGRYHDRREVSDLVDMIEDEGLTDLVVISHGWNNNTEEATALYTELLTNMRTLLDQGTTPTVAGAKVGVLGVYWPSKKFTDADLIPGGGAAAPDDLLAREVDRFVSLSGQPDATELGAAAKALLPRLDDHAAADEFVRLMMQLTQEPGGGMGDPMPPAVGAEDGHRILEELAEVDLDDEGTDFEGGGAEVLGGVSNGTRRFLNLLTYFQMKKRAGTIGENGLIAVLRTVRRDAPATRIHLVGHSFGGRLVTAASSSMGYYGIRIVKTMTLLQAAFSHNGFATNYHGDLDGYFRHAVTKDGVEVKIAVTHTHNDGANKTAYALASRLHQAHGSAVGGPDDLYGAIGANGALEQFTPEAEAVTMPPAGQAPHFRAGRINNFQADDFIRDHGDVRNINVANLVLHVLATAL